MTTTISRDQVPANVAPDDLQIERYTGTQYQPLSTDVISTDAEEVTLRAETPGFSIFVVSAPVPAAATSTPTAATTPTPTPVSAQTQTPATDVTPTATATETPTSTPSDVPGFGATVAILAVLIATLAIYRRL